MAQPTDWDDVGLVELLPSIHTLFENYNSAYFDGLLTGCIVEWSDRMTSCAGLCYHVQKRQHPTCIIRLARKLLQYRPFSDTINTLLHEMIHAYIFVKFGGTLNRDGHGPDFQHLMNKINLAAGANITIYHSFHNEVVHLKQHKWKCQGPCQNFSPFFGLVQRAVNRPPQPADWWWSKHQRICGGNFVKVSQPNPPKPASGKKSPETTMQPANRHAPTIPTEQQRLDNYFSKLKRPGRTIGNGFLATHACTKESGNEVKVIIDLIDT